MMDEINVIYNCARNTRRRWQMVVFYGMLNVGAIHAFVVCHINMNPQMAMGEFVKNLSPNLMSDHASVRASLRHVPWYFPMPYMF